MGGDKEATPKQNFLIFVREAVLTAGIGILIAAVLSYWLKRMSWYQFAEILTLVGAAIMVFGAAGPLGFWNQTRSLKYQYGVMHTGVDVYERIRDNNKEAQISYRFMYLFMTAGGLLILLAILIHQVVG